MSNQQKQIGDIISPTTLTTIKNQNITIPASNQLTHIQFRRFAGCPVCNLHIQSFFQRSAELVNIQEVIVFQASPQKMRESVVDAPFHLIADAKRNLYKAFGLQNSWKSLLHASVLTTAIKGLTVKKLSLPEQLETELIVPADFLIDEKGKIIAFNYGKHANDQWSVDELLAIVNNYQQD